MGFFVYRHLGLVGCNFVYMKRFLPLLILISLVYWSCEDVSPTAVDLTFKVIETNIISEWTQNDDDIKIGGGN